MRVGRVDGIFPPLPEPCITAAMVSPLGVGVITVYLALKYGVVVAPGGRPASSQVVLALPPIVVAVSLLIAAEHEPAYTATTLIVAAMPLGAPKIAKPIVGAFAATLVGVRAFHGGHVAVATVALAAAAILLGFIATTPSLR